MTATALTPIAALITSRCRELGFGRGELVQRAGYRNVAKGIRRLDALLAGDFETTQRLIDGLAVALILPADAIYLAIEATRR